MSEAIIHPTAIVDPQTQLGRGVQVSPYAIIEEGTEIGDHTKIGYHAVIHSGTKIGAHCNIHIGACIGGAPQDLKYNNESTSTHIGDYTSIREYATINRGTSASGTTQIGSHCLIMAYSHIAHDCIVGNHCITSINTGMGGHTEVGDWAIIGSNGRAIHQFSKIGQHTMVSSDVKQDIPPYVLVGREPGRFYGINYRGLKKRNFTTEVIAQIKEIYDIIYHNGLNRNKSLEEVLKRVPASAERSHIVEFIQSSTRGIIRA